MQSLRTRVTGALRRSLVPALVATGGLAVATAALAADPSLSQAATTTTNPIVFGIYPGGVAGGDTGAVPDNYARDLAGVQQLDSSGAPFLVHLYAEYFGPNTWTAQQLVGSELSLFAKAGIETELVLRYSPNSANASVDVPGYVNWVDQALRVMGSQISYVQITNEANINGASDNDGTFAGADQALVDGIESAKRFIVSHHLQTRVGFNWSYDASAGGPAWWSSLKALGGSTFANDVDWVGVDTYPGTWQPLPTTLSFGSGVQQVTTQALQATRSDMALAGIGAGVPIHVAETGYPTGPNRTYAMQETALESEVQAVLDASAPDNVTAMQFFDLRDAITNSTDYNDQYGLMTDTWTPKPAFGAYEALIAQYGGAPTQATSPPAGSTSPSPATSAPQPAAAPRPAATATATATATPTRRAVTARETGAARRRARRHKKSKRHRRRDH